MKARLFLQLFCSMACFASAPARAETVEIPFTPAAWHPVTFSKIAATVYELHGEQLDAKADKSSALLVTPWDKPRKVRAVSFEWKGLGDIHMPDGEAEKTKKGDDARLKIALLIHGPAPFVPFFAPGWVKAIKKIMKHPTDRALNLTVSKHLPDGTTWESPYTSSIEHVTVKGSAEKDGWHRVDYQLAKPVEVVGLWLMVDGDDTGSSFSTSVRHLKVSTDE